MCKVIGVVSLKGGVGKTSTVSSLGAALAEFGKKVLLVDANFSAPNLGIHFKVIDPKITLHHVLGRKSNVGDAIHNCGKIDLIPSSLYNKIKFNPLKLKDKLAILKRKYDVILLDSSPALGEETLATMLASDEIVVVTTPDHPTLSTTFKAIKLARQRGVPISGLILNKVHNKNFEISLRDVEKTAEVPVLAVIPYDVNVLKSLANFVPFVSYKPNSGGSLEYKKLAATLVGEKYKSFSFGELFRRIVPKPQEINREILYERIFID